MFGRKKGIGLYIGSNYAALSIVSRQKKGLQVVSCGGLAITETGSITGEGDPEVLGNELAEIVEDMSCKGKRVISAVGGLQIYMRNMILPKMKLKELRAAAFFEAAVVLPIPLEEAAIDVYPIREFSDSEGMKIEMSFVAVRRQPVEKLKKVCNIAGLRLAAVELETIAIYRVIADRSPAEPLAFLFIGDGYSVFSVFKYGAVIFQRYYSLGADTLEPEQKNGSVVRLTREVSLSLEHFHLQFGYEIAEPVIICGDGANLENLDILLSSVLGKNFIVNSAPGDLETSFGFVEAELKHYMGGYLISCGLAAREVV